MIQTIYTAPQYYYLQWIIKTPLFGLDLDIWQMTTSVNDYARGIKHKAELFHSNFLYMYQYGKETKIHVHEPE